MVSKFAVDMIDKARILASFCSDHSCVWLDLSSLAKNEKGNGFWKFNNSLINDLDYVNSMKEKIRRWDAQYEEMKDKRVKWELIKFEIRKYTCLYSANKKKEQHHEEKFHQDKLNQLEVVLGNSPSEDSCIEYNACKARLKEIQDFKANGAIVRSRVR